MVMTLEVATARLSRELPLAETSLDDALINITKLMTSMVIARKETGAAPATGHSALMRLIKAQEAVVTASGEMARVHGQMLTVGREVGALDIEKCPPPFDAVTEQTRAAA